MKNSWSCNHCDYQTYAANRGALETNVKQHLVTNGGNVLLYEPPGDALCADCLDLLSPHPVDRTALLFVTRDPARHLQQWRERAGAWPARLSIVTPGNPSLTNDVVTEADLSKASPAVSRVKSRDLSELGIKISEALKWFDGRDLGIVVCFDSLSALLTDFEVKELFQFASLVAERVRRVDGLGHFHMTPAEHMGSTVHVFEELFDLIVDARPGEESVRFP